jgi:hypothetical protein
MPSFEVTVCYEGCISYIVEASSVEVATELAKEKYMKDEPGNPTGSDFETIQDIINQKLPKVEEQ